VVHYRDAQLFVATSQTPALLGIDVMITWKQQVERFKGEAQVFSIAFKHPRMPKWGRLVALCTAGYLVSPIQLVPNFIPVFGLLDDFIVLLLGIKLLRKITPPDVLAESRELAASRRQLKGEFGSAAIMVSAVITTLWLFGSAISGAAIFMFFFHRY